MKICGIRFKDLGKTYYFLDNDLELKKGMTVVVETEKGEQLAKIADVDVENVKNVDTSTMKTVSRISTEKDYNTYLKNVKDSMEALKYAKKLILDSGLNMKLLDATYTLDRKQLSFNFVADERVDFRNLVKDIAAKYKTRIELHQIGVRDKSREIGGLGQCGRSLCCGSFLSGMETISINMAKNQNIALNPSKINGACGRLMCCLSYEDNVYCENRKNLPKMGQMVHTEFGDGRVVSLDILRKKYVVEVEGTRYDIESK